MFEIASWRQLWDAGIGFTNFVLVTEAFQYMIQSDGKRIQLLGSPSLAQSLVEPFTQRQVLAVAQMSDGIVRVRRNSPLLFCLPASPIEVTIGNPSDYCLTSQV